jgi:hypothetical protein
MRCKLVEGLARVTVRPRLEFGRRVDRVDATTSNHVPVVAIVEPADAKRNHTNCDELLGCHAQRVARVGVLSKSIRKRFELKRMRTGQTC